MSVKKHTANLREVALSINELSKMLKVSEFEVRQAASLLLMNNEIKEEIINNEVHIGAWENSFVVYSNKKYLREGETRVIGRIKDYLGVTGSTIAIVTAVVTGVTSVISIISNKKKIEELQVKVTEIQEKVEPASQSKNSRTTHRQETDSLPNPYSTSAKDSIGFDKH